MAVHFSRRRVRVEVGWVMRKAVGVVLHGGVEVQGLQRAARGLAEEVVAEGRKRGGRWPLHPWRPQRHSWDRRQRLACQPQVLWLRAQVLWLRDHILRHIWKTHISLGT